MIVIVLWLFLLVPWVGLQCVIVVFSDHTHLLYCNTNGISSKYATVFLDKTTGTERHDVLKL